MKTIRYFYRTYGVPGDAALPLPPGMRPTNAVIARAVYKVYPDSRSVVFSGIDQTMPTNAATTSIIKLIAEREGLPVHDYSFFDLQTSMQDRIIDSGDYRFYAVFLKPGSSPPEAECVVEVDCPDVVLDDFERYVESEFYGASEGYSSTAAEYPDVDADLDEDDDDED